MLKLLKKNPSQGHATITMSKLKLLPAIEMVWGQMPDDFQIQGNGQL